TRTAVNIVTHPAARTPNHMGRLRACEKAAAATGSVSPCSLVRASGPSATWSLGMIGASALGPAPTISLGAGAWHNQHLDASGLRRVPQDIHQRISEPPYPSSEASTKSSRKLEGARRFPLLGVREPTGGRVGGQTPRW